MSTTPKPIAVTLLLALALAACGGADTGRDAGVRDAPAPAGTRYVVTDSTLLDGIEASGTAQPVQRAVLATRLMARVSAVLVHEGDHVTAGQVLARLDASELDAKRERLAAGLAAAEAMRRDAETTARRFRALHADSAAPRAQLDQAEVALARAESGVREANAAASELDAVGDYATLRAPFPGIVVRRHVDPGAFAAPGDPLLTVEDHSSLRVTVTAAPGAARGVRRGSVLRGEIAGTAIVARVEGVVPAPGGHLVTINALVDNRGGEMIAGGSASLQLATTTRTGRLIPSAAVVRQGDLTGVRLIRGGALELRWIRPGVSDAGLIEVLTGLEPGDTVLVPAGDR